MPILKDKKTELIQEYKINEVDTGSSEVQCAILTEKISALAAHLLLHKHDHSSRRGLLKMVNKRRRLLGFLKRTESERYSSLIVRLGLRDTAGKHRTSRQC